MPIDPAQRRRDSTEILFGSWSVCSAVEFFITNGDFGGGRSMRRSVITSGAGGVCLYLRVSIQNSVISGGSFRSMRRSGITSGAGGEF